MSRRLWPTRMLRRYPATIAVSAVTVTLFVLQLITPVVVLFQQDPQRFIAGEWWRLVTPMFVQGYGLGQFAFNLAGIVLVGVAVEEHFGWLRWMVVYLTSGMVAIVLTSLWFPDATDSGASAGVAGLIGALTVLITMRPKLPAWPAFLYAAFFVVYLGALALGGVVAGAIAGSLTLPALTVARRMLPATRFRMLLVALLTAGGILLVVLRDAHGVGVVAGIVLALLLGRRDAQRTAA